MEFYSLLDPQQVIEALARAAAVLRAGGLVAFPTETVYGLGARADDPLAVRRIFAAKGRPATNPVIVHVATMAQAASLAALWPARAEKLAQSFWPGPLTIVVPRAPCVPLEVTAGGPTVGLRIPGHPAALALLNTVGLPIAAPSANRASGISPTTAAHVAAGLADTVDLLLDGGPTPGGIESTVIDLADDCPRLLRPGLITREMLASALGEPVEWSADREESPSAPARAPGQQARHYAPRAPLELADDDGAARVAELAHSGLCVGWLTCGPVGSSHVATLQVELPADPEGYAARLYAALHTLDARNVDRIVVGSVPGGADWLAVRNRLGRAAAPE